MSMYARILIAVGIVTALPYGAWAATLSLSPSTGSFTAGNIFSVQIVLDTQGSLVQGVDVQYLNYNPALLEVQDENASAAGVQILPGTLMSNTQINTVDTTQGRISFSQVTTGNTSFTGSGTLATVRFRALAQGNAAATFNFTPGSTADTNVASNGVDVLSAVTNGSYTLTAVVTPPPPSPTPTPTPTPTPPPSGTLPTLVLSPSSGPRVTGETVTMSILLDTRGDAIDGVDVVMSYPTSLVKIADADPDTDGTQIAAGTLLPNTPRNEATQYGQILFSQTTNGGTTFTGSGTLATFSMTFAAPGTVNLAFAFSSGRTTDTNVSLGGADLLEAVVNASFTVAENGQPPAVTNPLPSGIVPFASSMKLQVTTNETATCRYAASAGTPYEQMTRTFSSSMAGTEHTATLFSGTFQQGSNSFFVRCRDRAGNVNAADTAISFTVVTDTTPPVINRPLPDGAFFMPKNIHISVLPSDEVGVLACKFSRTPGVSYDAMTRFLFPHRLAAFFFEEDEVFSLLILGRELTVGQNNFYIRCKDRAGNVNTSDAIVSFTLLQQPRLVIPLEGLTNMSFQTVTVKLEHPTAIRHSLPPHPTEYTLVTRLTSTGTVELLADNTIKNTMLTPAAGYTITVSVDRYLTRKATNVTLAEGAQIAFPPLLAGDLNRDGIINSIDLSVMIGQWARSFFGGTADINRDGRVNTVDWGFLRKNWLLAGE